MALIHRAASFLTVTDERYTTRWPAGQKTAGIIPETVTPGWREADP